MTDKIDPGPGYRLLEVGEVRPDGYSVLRECGEWFRGMYFGSIVREGDGLCRVKLPTPTDPPKHGRRGALPDDFRDMEPGDVIPPGAMYEVRENEWKYASGVTIGKVYNPTRNPTQIGHAPHAVPIAQQRIESPEERPDWAKARDAHLSTAIGYLDNAAREMRDRATSYDSPDGERSMGKAVAALNSIAGDDIARGGVRECHGWLLLELVKHVRQYANGPHQDSAVDSVAYAALHAEARMGEAKN